MTDTKEIMLEEYKKIKEEQAKRIGFRDNLIYFNILVISGILSFVINQKTYYGVLIVGWSTLILGWTYLINDEKISSIGRYLRNNLSSSIRRELKLPSDREIIGWEVAHRSDQRRYRRKVEQLIVDQVTFSVPGLASVSSFLYLQNDPVRIALFAAYMLIVLHVVLAMEIWLYADLGVGK